MRVCDIPEGAILAYRPTPRLLAFLGIELAEQMAGVKNSRYVHVSIWMGEYEVAALGDKGVTVCEDAPQGCDVLMPRRINAGKRDAALNWVDNKVGKTPYAWWDLAWVWFLRRFKLHRVFDWPECSMICSVLAARYLKKAGIDAFPAMFCCEVMPCDFADNPDFAYLGSL